MGTQYYEHDDCWIEVPQPRKLTEVEHCEISKALAFYNGSQKQAARALGISPRVLGYKLHRYGIPLAQAGEDRKPSGRKPQARVSGDLSSSR